MNRVSFGWAVVCLSGLACSSAAPQEGTEVDAGAGGDASAGSVTFTELYSTVIQPNCSSHHAPGAVDGFLDLSTRASAYAAFTKAPSGPSCGANGFASIVVAGSAATSLLYEKVSTSSPPCGAQMPVGAPLGAADQALIATWINAGALDD